MNGKSIKETLRTISTESMTDGTMGELWTKLPDYVSGSNWVGEIADASHTLEDYFLDEDDYNEDKMADLVHMFASSEVEDYHNHINKRVQDLSLWAWAELDDEVQEMNSSRSYPTLTDLNLQYLYSAMYRLGTALLEYVAEKVEQGEEASL